MSNTRRRDTGHLRLLSTLIGTAITAALPQACGQSGNATQDAGVAQDASGEAAVDATDASDDSIEASGSSSGDDGNAAESGSSSGIDASSSSGSGSGSSSSGPCPTPTVTNFMIDSSRCVPQLQSESANGSYVCQWTIQQPCFGDAGVAEAGAADGGDAGPPDPCAVCDELVDGGNNGNTCSTMLVPTGGFVTQCGVCCIGGRAPRGFRPAPARGRSGRAARLAQMAQLEAASVDAFHALHADLTRLGAPRRLLAAVRTAAGDEVRHARAVRRAAERFGARVPRARLAPIASRSAEQLALENAEEGCVRETFGAALAAVQAERASDAGVRCMMRVIAREELSHAALAWDVARWLDRRLDAAARARVGRARAAALARLDAEIRSDREPNGDAVLGLPDARSSLAVLARLRLPLARGLT